MMTVSAFLPPRKSPAWLRLFGRYNLSITAAVDSAFGEGGVFWVMDKLLRPPLLIPFPVPGVPGNYLDMVLSWYRGIVVS